MAEKSCYEYYLDECQRVLDVIADHADENGICKASINEINDLLGLDASQVQKTKKKISTLLFKGSPISKVPGGYLVKSRSLTDGGFFYEMPIVALLLGFFNTEEIQKDGMSVSTFFGFPKRLYQLAILYLYDEKSQAFLCDYFRTHIESYKVILDYYIMRYPEYIRPEVILMTESFLKKNYPDKF